MQRLRISGSSIAGYLSLPQFRRKALNSWSAVQDTFYSTKEIFESHRVVFTIATSLGSIATAWGDTCGDSAGYTLRHLHETKVEERLESIERAMRDNHRIEPTEFKKIVKSGNSSTGAYVATAGTSLIIGYGLGWRGGRWYANRKFRKEQMKLLGQIKPKRWPLKFLRRPLTRPNFLETVIAKQKGLRKDVPFANNSGEAHQAC